MKVETVMNRGLPEPAELDDIIVYLICQDSHMIIIKVNDMVLQSWDCLPDCKVCRLYTLPVEVM